MINKALDDYRDDRHEDGNRFRSQERTMATLTIRCEPFAGETRACDRTVCKKQATQRFELTSTIEGADPVPPYFVCDECALLLGGVAMDAMRKAVTTP